MHMKHHIVYHIARGYRRVVAWEGDRRTGTRKATLIMTPRPGLPRAERYRECCRFLKSLSVPCPVYVPTKTQNPTTP